MNQGAMLNAYPDSMGKNLSEMIDLLSRPEMKDAFRSFYLLPTVFNTDLDRGFSVISYDLCESLAKAEDLAALGEMGIDLTFDMILNHLSVLSPQFQDILKHGKESRYRDFFIDWNRFWAGSGEMGEDGWIIPTPERFASMSLRKNSLPILMTYLPDGSRVPYWNTFYQKIIYPPVDVFDMLDITESRYDVALRLAERINDQLQQEIAPVHMDWTGFEPYRQQAVALLESRRRFLGQMDVNVQSPLVWAWYGSVMKQLAGYGAKTLRLDAFTRLHKAPGRLNFMNEPETWDILRRLMDMAASYGLDVLPEIHATKTSGAYRKLADLGCVIYDYFLPGLILDALDTSETKWIFNWAKEQIDSGLHVVNMLGCHDGIPMRDVRGALPDDRVDAMIERLCARGGRRKMIHGANPETYQMDISYYSALGSDDAKMLMARAIQLFMPGKPQIWYMDLLAGENDEEIFRLQPDADNREINRHSYSKQDVEERLKLPVVAQQLRMLAMRNTHKAFADGATVTVEQPQPYALRLTWKNGGAWATLDADLRAMRYDITSSV